RARRGAAPPGRAGRERRRSPLAGRRRHPPRPRTNDGGPRRPRRGPRSRERPRGDRRSAALGGRRQLQPRGKPGDQRSRPRSCLRRGCPVTSGVYAGYGGRYVPETLIPALDELEAGWAEAQADPSFAAELDRLGREYAGRPTPLTLAERFAPGKRIYLKREDLLHTGAHKLNNALGQAVLARRLGKHRIVAETGAGQH